MAASAVSDPNFFSEADRPENRRCPNLLSTNHWGRHVKSAPLHVVSLAGLTCVLAWGSALSP
jgi:hypothetical protein